MEQLVARLSGLDAEAEFALKVITYFDKLNEGHVGLETLVRGAAVLSRHTAGLLDADQHVRLRVQPDGRAATLPGGPDSAWPTISIFENGEGVAWLETCDRRPVDDLILERLALGVRALFDRTHRRVVKDDVAALEVLFDPTLPEPVRLESARRLGWDATALVRAVAVLPDRPGPGSAETLKVLEPANGDTPPSRPPGRSGLGGDVPIIDAATSWRQARIALRFTAAGTPDDPGPCHVVYSELGALALLADVIGPSKAPPADVVTLDRAADSAPWLLETLSHLVTHNSLRAASEAAHLHHSSLQMRVAHAEQLLGWSLTDPDGRLRVQMALVARRLHRVG
jgi:hypothetical protein